jgi:hypothetical protein
VNGNVAASVDVFFCAAFCASADGTPMNEVLTRDDRIQGSPRSARAGFAPTASGHFAAARSAKRAAALFLIP